MVLERDGVVNTHTHTHKHKQHKKSKAEYKLEERPQFKRNGLEGALK